MQPDQNNIQPQTGKTSFRRGLVFLLIWVIALAAIFSQRQAIADFAALWGYTPPPEITRLAEQTSMNEAARRVFYINKPDIVTKKDFITKCPNALREQTIVLGCYHGNQNGIYLLGVEDARLDGVVQVTAAHEMLHAFYDRLDRKEKASVDAMLLDYYRNQLNDQRIRDTIEGYRKTEPNDLKNEMHSIFATEIAALPAHLENYYKQYFTDRQAVVGFASQYETEFSSRRGIVAAHDAKLVALKQEIDAAEQRLRSEQELIAARRAQLESQQSSGDIDGFNAGVPEYNALVERYNQGVANAQSMVAQYNALVAERNAVAAEISELTEALSTKLDPINN